MTSAKKARKAEDPEQIKAKIIRLFNKNVKGKKPDSSTSNVRHDGKDGHWLEVQMGVAHNASNSPDLYGFEMKNHTSGKTTFGDWSANYYIFKDEKYGIDREKFLTIFGAPNLAKKNRYSWSGKPTPKVDVYNSFGQILKVDDKGNIFAIYSYNEDKRVDKSKIVPKTIQKNDLLIAEWSAEMMKKRVEQKFNKLGWFKCLKDNTGAYSSIVFGAPIKFSSWIKGVRKGLIFFDSGMYQGNIRPYSQWRADNKYWDSLVTDIH
jgi:hypothetical protein